MSLLNEALRKSQSKGHYRVSPDLSPKKYFKLKYAILIGACAVLGVVIWLFMHKTSVPDQSLVIPETTNVAQETQPVAREATASIETSAISDTQGPAMALEKESTTAPASSAPAARTTNKKTDNQQKSSGNAAINKEASIERAVTEPEKKTLTASSKKPPAADDKADNKNASSTIPPAVKEDMSAVADRYYQKALQLHRDGRIEEAIGMYQQALKYSPENPGANYNLSSAYIELSNFSSACDLLKNLLTSNPGDPEILLNLAVAEIGSKRPSEAIDLLKSIETEDKGLRFSSFFHMGVAASQLGKPEEALTYYKQAEELKGDYPKLLYNMAILNDRLENYREASGYYQRYLSTGSSPEAEAEDVKKRIKVLQSHISGQGIENPAKPGTAD